MEGYAVTPLTARRHFVLQGRKTHNDEIELMQRLVQTGLPLTGKWLLYGFGSMLAAAGSCVWFRIVLWSAIPYSGKVDRIGREALFTQFLPAFALFGALTWWFSALAARGETRRFSAWGAWGVVALSGTWVLLVPTGLMAGLVFLLAALMVSFAMLVRVRLTKRHACDLLVIPVAVVLTALCLSYIDQWWILYGD